MEDFSIEPMYMMSALPGHTYNGPDMMTQSQLDILKGIGDDSTRLHYNIPAGSTLIDILRAFPENRCLFKGKIETWQLGVRAN